jgi:hypothetical protein
MAAHTRRNSIIGIFILSAIFAAASIAFHRNAKVAAAASAAIDQEAAAPSMTIYNGGFGVVRQIVPLELQSGINSVRFADTTAHVETASVILRDPSGLHKMQILEQSYRADALSQQLLLSLNEGKVIEFEKPDHSIIKGKIIRSGYQPHTNSYQTYGQQYYQEQMAMTQEAGTPIIEVDGKLIFGLPGTPIFSSLGEDTILKPELDWKMRTENPGAFNAEVSYITGGMRWQSDYNLVAPENCGPGPKCPMEMIGWVTFDNQSGKTFQNARVKLMAGDVNKLTQPESRAYAMKAMDVMEVNAAAPPVVTEKAFSDLHLYNLANPVTLRDRETKQVEFIRASIKDAERLYIYDGANYDQYRGWNVESIRQNPEYGTQSNPKVWIMQQFKNNEANGLGMPLPQGRLRFYKRDSDGRLEFTGENQITHTPKDELVRVYTGNAFDVVGERRRTDYHVDNNAHTIDESFEIKVRNHKDEPVDVRVVEHLYRWSNWQITSATFKHDRTDSRTAEFRVTVPKDGEQILRYTVHYSWA